jgi:N-acetylmuramoyl-L-alanine amidase
VVALDSGHGGVDPGGIGASGTYEKHITLAMAREIGAALEKTGRYKAVLVRDRDVFIRLRDRIAIARTAGADLFISLHADVIANKAVRGLSVYTLSEKASDEESALLADMSNKSDLIAGVDLSNKTLEVTNILIDLAQRETMNDSSRFAGHVVKQLSRETKLLNNTHRFAGFAVLKAPDVPSVLIELGFLSNVDDEAALKNRSYRDKLSQATVRAVEDYFQEMEQAQAR